MDKYMIKPNTTPVNRVIEMPQKLFYKIGEVSRITSLEPYVLRYWETEFPFLKPKKGKSKQRLYQKKDIEVLLEIKRLLYEERLTIEGVRKRLAKNYIDVIKTESKHVENSLHSNDNDDNTAPTTVKEGLKQEVISNIRIKLNTLLHTLK